MRPALVLVAAAVGLVVKSCGVVPGSAPVDCFSDTGGIEKPGAVLAYPELMWLVLPVVEGAPALREEVTEPAPVDVPVGYRVVTPVGGELLRAGSATRFASWTVQRSLLKQARSVSEGALLVGVHPVGNVSVIANLHGDASVSFLGRCAPETTGSVWAQFLSQQAPGLTEADLLRDVVTDGSDAAAAYKRFVAD